MIAELNAWIEGTRASLVVQTVTWIIPALQSIHILAIAVVISTMAMLNLRLVGLTHRRHSIAHLSKRFLPWLWGALGVLLVTGTILVIGEPRRSLGNWVFQLKMLLLLSALVVTFGFQNVLRRNLHRWDSSISLDLTAKATGMISLLLWFGIIVAGRWIAYVSPG